MKKKKLYFIDENKILKNKTLKFLEIFFKFFKFI